MRSMEITSELNDSNFSKVEKTKDWFAEHLKENEGWVWGDSNYSLLLNYAVKRHKRETNARM